MCIQRLILLIVFFQAKSYEGSPRLIIAQQSTQAIVDAGSPWPMLIGKCACHYRGGQPHVWRQLAIVCRPKVMWKDQDQQPLSYVHKTRMMRQVHARRLPRNMHRRGPIQQSMTNVAWPMRFSLAYVSCPKHLGLGWCFTLLANGEFTLPMWTHHN